MSRPLTHRALAPLKDRFPAAGLRGNMFRDQTTVLVPREQLKPVITFLRDDPTLRYDMLFELNGIDYLKFPGAKHRFAVNYGLLSLPNNDRLWLKVYLDPELPTGPGTAVPDSEAAAKGDPGLKLETVTDVYASADWMERECYDMFGFIFLGHPDLRRIMTWSAFGSHPLRKDYPLRGVGERENYKIVTREGA